MENYCNFTKDQLLSVLARIGIQTTGSMTKRQLLSLIPIEGKVALYAECWNENEADGVNDALPDDV
jgi:hypothetical protein